MGKKKIYSCGECVQLFSGRVQYDYHMNAHRRTALPVKKVVAAHRRTALPVKKVVAAHRRTALPVKKVVAPKPATVYTDPTGEQAPQR